eukprot:439431_1
MPSPLSISGYLAVITGAADGIGKGVCYKFANEGCNLALVDINADKLNEVCKELKSLHPSLKINAFQCDVSNANEINDLVQKIKTTFDTNSIQILFNNAGIFYEEILNGNIDKMRKLMDVNLWGMIYSIKAFKSMLLNNKRNKKCFILNTGSMASVLTGSSMYSVSKHAVIALSETISNEFQKYYPKSNILISTLTPLFVKTNLTDNSAKIFSSYDLKSNDKELELSPEILKFLEMTGIDIEECAQIVFEAMENKQTVIPTNIEFHEAAIKDRMKSLLLYKPNLFANWVKQYQHLFSANTSKL